MQGYCGFQGKLVKLFSHQLVLKRRHSGVEFPKGLDGCPFLKQWLHVGLYSRVGKLETLLSKTDSEIRSILYDYQASDEEVRRLQSAVHNLKRYTEILFLGDPSGGGDFPLYWDSWDRTSPLSHSLPIGYRSGKRRTKQPPAHNADSSLPVSEVSSPSHSVGSHHGSPPGTPSSAMKRSKGVSSGQGTPSARRKHQTGLLQPNNESITTVGNVGSITTSCPSQAGSASAGYNAEGFPLIKSKSHESQLGNKVDIDTSSARRRRLPTDSAIDCLDPCSLSSLLSSPVRSPPFASDSDSDSTSKCASMKSPRTPTLPGSMSHVIQHRFSKTVKVTTCDYCNKQMFYGVKCKECKYKCHRDCESHVPPSCGLPQEYLNIFTQSITGSPVIGRSWASPHHGPSSAPLTLLNRWKGAGLNTSAFHAADSNSTPSSCNSSTPSSPALVITTTTPPITSRHQHFLFPEPASSPGAEGPDLITLNTHPLHEVKMSTGSIGYSMVSSNPSMVDTLTDTVKSGDSDRTVSITSGSGSTDSERTLAMRLDSQDSQASETGDYERWPRQNSRFCAEGDNFQAELWLEINPGVIILMNDPQGR
ncbi:unnamed protein product [Darwinula stevensoni]|uniref:Phorbol-ester/DAG-type domain-containing protein n=1 Tax=Darwinula stevensoni TaxID=69355 RepID=A0A7R8XAL4_9CRUS|nr:unnamed protein product [Darwinula stevensoni]CAG0885668.1 unnamed protein product [Darwinula stevensoni]